MKTNALLQIETPHHNFDYDSILNYTPIAIPASMEMKCVPKPDADDINNYDYDVSIFIVENLTQSFIIRIKIP